MVMLLQNNIQSQFRNFLDLERWSWCLSNHLTSKIRNSISKASSSQKFSCSFDLTLLIHFAARLVYQLLLFFVFTSRLASSLFYWRHVITSIDKGLNKRFDFFRLKFKRGSQKAKIFGSQQSFRFYAKDFWLTKIFSLFLSSYIILIVLLKSVNLSRKKEFPFEVFFNFWKD